MSLSEVLDEVKTRKNFYRNLYRKVVALLLGGVILLYILLAGILFKTLTRETTQFYATSNDGTVAPLKVAPPPATPSTQPVEQY